MKKMNDTDFLKEARKNIESWFDYFSENVDRAKKDIEFALMSQWDSNNKGRRLNEGKPTFELNQLYAHVSAIIGEQRQNTPNILVHPVSSHVEQQDIDLREGIIRQVLYESKSDIVFQEAFKWTMVGGFSALRIITEYESPESFHQNIRLTHLSDPTTAFFDPSAEKPDKSDGRFCGVYKTLTREEFKRRYPDQSVPLSFDQSGHFTWKTDKTVTIAEYFVKEYFTTTIVQLSNGNVLKKADAQKLLTEQPAITILNERDAEDYKILHYQLTGHAILEKNEWPSKDLPIIFVDGDSFYREGQQITKSFIHYAKDAQRYLNYIASEAALAVLNRRREEWLATPENIKNNEDAWKYPDRVQGAIIFTPDSRTGFIPQKIPPSEISATLMAQYERAKQDIKQILGRYEANLGMPGNEQSGVAIMNRVKQGNASTFVYFVNLNRAVESCARVILNLIPVVMDTTRTIPIRKRDQSQQLVTINNPVGDQYHHDLNQVRYSVRVEAGPNYAVQKAESLQQLMQLATSSPQIGQLIPDLIAGNLELENMPQIVDRLKTLLPPHILAQEEGKPLPPTPPNPQMQLQQQQMQVEQMKVENEANKIALERYKLGDR